MWFELRTEDLTFLGRAPVVHVVEAGFAAPRPAVFAAFADAAGWPQWFPNVAAASYDGPPPYGVGTIRRATVGGTEWVEQILAWDDGARLAWTVTRASVPLARAQVESFDFADVGSGTRLRWTLALEPRLLARLGAPVARGVVERLLKRAATNLSARLQAAGGGAARGQ